jgi:hypothetical protein
MKVIKPLKVLIMQRILHLLSNLTKVMLDKRNNKNNKKEVKEAGANYTKIGLIAGGIALAAIIYFTVVRK